MTTVYASEIGAWRYDPPLDCYDMTAVDASVLAQPDSGFYALLVGPISLASGHSVPTAKFRAVAMTPKPWTPVGACAPTLWGTVLVGRPSRLGCHSAVQCSRPMHSG